MAQRATNFANAAQRILKICGGGVLPPTSSITSLSNLGENRSRERARALPGTARRPNLLHPKNVFLELANQALLYKDVFRNEAPAKDLWTWSPKYRSLPQQNWKGESEILPLTTRPSRRVRGKTPNLNIVPRE